MNRLLGALLTATVFSGLNAAAQADDKDVTAVLDKAIAALGGEARLQKAATATWSSKGTITFGDNESSFKGRTTVQGIERHRAEFDGEFNGNPTHGVTIVDGDKGWRRFNDNLMELEGDSLAGEKRRAYLQLVPMTILPLKGKGFRVHSAPDEKVGDKPAAVVKATGPDGKEFALYFDKESGLPVKLTATVRGFQGDDILQETSFSEYKDFDGIKKATKIESKRDGNRFVSVELAEFKVLDAIAPGTFDEPK